MKHTRKLLCAALALMLVLGASVTAFAADEVMTNDNIDISKPTNGKTIYIGETIKFKARVWNPWGGTYWCRPFAMIIKDGASKTSKEKAYDYMTSAGYMDISASFATSKLKKGTYYLAVILMPIYAGTTVEVPINGSYNNKPAAGLTLHLKKLQAPGSVKAKAGKKKVTVTYAAAKGASSYIIYRSTKKSSGYSKIGTSKTTKYVDKKAKKGKTYYYKVKTVRNVSGKVTSGFSKAAGSGKVK
ncbi:MAG: hypothetical protein IIY86_04965 [Lachnospiraceae bacterium]|nr:hypothetical protein [Lachnospiraceae bacterium]